jgi:hypothetical protein
MPNFMNSLQTTLEEVKRPPLLPVGTYRAQVNKIPEIIDEHDRYQYVDFQLRIVQPEDNVDQDELQEFGGLNNVIRRHRFLFDKDDEAAFKRAEYQLKRFLTDHLQVDPALGFKEAMDSAPGHSCLVDIGRRADKQDKDIIYEDIKRTAPVE